MSLVLLDIARTFDLGYSEIVNPWLAAARDPEHQVQVGVILISGGSIAPKAGAKSCGLAHFAC